MKRLKSDDGETVDRLSSLPESLIFEILSFLETRDVVTTSLLSKRWNDLWTTIPYLDFNDSKGNVIQTQNFINGVWRRWKGTKLMRLNISFMKACYLSKSISNDMALWVGFTTEKNVEDLNLELPDEWGVKPPECVYSCSSITKLRLTGFWFQTKHGPRPVNHHHYNVQWDRLKSLEMDGRYINEDLLNQIVSSSPMLEALTVLCYDDHEEECRGNLSIRSSSLKRLAFGEKSENYDPSTYPTITICAPNLEELFLFESVYCTRFVLRVPALIEAYICVHVNGDVGALKQLFLDIQHVETLILPLNDYKRLGLMNGECLFPNVTTLSLFWCCCIEPNDIVGVAEFFPKVEKLIIDGTILHKDDLGEKFLQSVANNLNALLPPNQRVCVWEDKKRCSVCSSAPSQL